MAQRRWQVGVVDVDEHRLRVAVPLRLRPATRSRSSTAGGSDTGHPLPVPTSQLRGLLGEPGGTMVEDLLDGLTLALSHGGTSRYACGPAIAGGRPCACRSSAPQGVQGPRGQGAAQRTALAAASAVLDAGGARP